MASGGATARGDAVLVGCRRADGVIRRDYAGVGVAMMTNNNALTPLSYAIADDIVTRLITMTDAERRQVATMLAELAPNVATALADAVLVAVAVGMAGRK